MKEAIERIMQFTSDTDFSAFIEDKMMYYAVLMNISIIGEAANLLSEEFKEAHPTTPWKMVRGMRNYMVHEYYKVDDSIVWEVVKQDLPLLHEQVDTYVNELNDEKTDEP